MCLLESAQGMETCSVHALWYYLIKGWLGERLALTKFTLNSTLLQVYISLYLLK